MVPIGRAALAAIALIFIASPAGAAERYHTFMGLTGGWGINRISYSGWVEDSHQNLDFTGSYYTTGLSFCAIITRAIGEFTVQYQGNSNGGDVDASYHSLYLSLAGKYYHELSRVFNVTAGAGLYGEIPPASMGYEGGAGVIAIVGAMITFTFDLRLMVDFQLRYGSFGLGEGSTRTSYGAAASFVYNVGRI